EPNGYLHIGHCKALCIDFGTAEKYGGLCNLRMDDTNPAKEDTEYVEAIQDDIHWLGFDWDDRFYYGSDYFEKDYEYAVELIKKGLAYVCDLTAEQFSEYRGDIGKPAISPYRDRSVEENLDLFQRMRNGEFPEGSHTLRAKIDLASGNFNMRDPVIYRIRYIHHHRQGDKWCIFPMYDFAHPIQDALEGITHSLCSLEYEDHRPLYDWVANNVSIPYHKPRQIEFARLGIDHTVMSKRKLRQLVEENRVSGWDDPRMPTLCGLRRRGYTAAAIRNFCERIGVAKSPSTIEYSFLEHCLREDLNLNAERTMAVLHPVKLIVTNYPEGQSETFSVENNPTNPAQGTHEITFSREIYVEADDFLEEPVPKYKRLYPGGPECRLKGAYLIQCTGCKKDENGNITEIYCTYDPESRGGDPADGRKVKGATIHWVDAATAVDAEVRLYGNLFSDAQPDGPDKNFLDCLNPESLTVLTGCKVEPRMLEVAKAYDAEENRTAKNAPGFQFMRVGYFCLDNRDSSADHLVFNRSVELKDSFKK
ncbi:MAG: glutamine--tRNA ligase/YqeY domain fusion protein, partial [Oscillospiraceae bacterium]|nr:glutamine--tRNA ligase/YqeY domain fusion protein [Oscillospiraceae bacterium]